MWQRARHSGRRWWLCGRRSRWLWRWGLLAVALLAMALAIFRQPLADRLWPEPRIQQLLDQGQAALAAGRLSADDGSGARELFQAALALDNDRTEARQALVRTGEAALEQARAALARGDPAQARSALALARELQVPRGPAERIAEQLRAQDAGHAGIEQLLQQAEAARLAGRLDDGGDSALPLYQRVLGFQPDRLEALEGREDALSELLQQARLLLGKGDLAAVADVLRRARGYDPGYFDLPAAQAAFNTALERRRVRAERDLARGRVAAAGEGFALVLAAAPDDAAARRGQEQVVAALVAEATRLSADFRFAAAEQALAHARALQPEAEQLVPAQQALERARQAQRAMQITLSPAAQERRLEELLSRFAAAEARGDWLLPPGRSAYDALRAAQALAPRDPRVRQAVERLLPATRECFEERLRENRLRAARVCHDAWQVLAPADGGLRQARRRLAQRWIAIGSERLGAGDTAFARQALQQARELDAATPEIAAFAERLRSASP